ncbi:MAG: DUF255 domain-containing protein [Gammaproteobacteria bacterium]
MPAIRSVLILCFLMFASLSSAQSLNNPDAKNSIHWQAYSDTTLNINKSDHRLIFIFGKAAWCEWCKKTENTTFKDPTVIKIINNYFTPVVLDIDKNRAAAISYEIINLPSFFIIDSHKHIIKKMYGYITASEMSLTLSQFTKDNVKKSPTEMMPVDAEINQEPILPDVTRLLLEEKQLLDYGKWDTEGGGINKNRKYISRFTTQYAAGLAMTGNEIARHWIITTLDNGTSLLDPVWGGMYAYSTQGDWNHPNYEKPLATQALAIRVYIIAYMLTGNREYYLMADKITQYLMNFLMSPDGAFYAGQAAKMKDGHQDADYYKLNDTLRRINGTPVVDKTVYAYTCGEGIDALATMYRVTGEKLYLDRAIKSAEWVIKHLGLPDGGFKHTENNNNGIYSIDSVKMSKAFFLLYTVSNNKGLVKNICGLTPVPEVCQAYDTAISEGFLPS